MEAAAHVSEKYLCVHVAPEAKVQDCERKLEADGVAWAMGGAPGEIFAIIEASVDESRQLIERINREDFVISVEEREPSSGK